MGVENENMIKTHYTKLSDNNNLFLKDHMKLGGESSSRNRGETGEEKRGMELIPCRL